MSLSIREKADTYLTFSARISHKSSFVKSGSRARSYAIRLKKNRASASVNRRAPRAVVLSGSGIGGEGERDGAAGSPTSASIATPAGTVERNPRPGVLARLLMVLRRELDEARSDSTGVSALTLVTLVFSTGVDDEARGILLGLASLDSLLIGVSDFRAFLRT